MQLTNTLLICLFTTTLLRHTTASSLDLANFYKLNFTSDIQDMMLGQITLSESFRFHMTKKRVTKDSYIITIYYKQDFDSYYFFDLNRMGSEYRSFKYTSPEIPFNCYRFYLYPTMKFKNKFYEIADNIRKKINGVYDILSVLNSVSWSKDMLEYFYANVQYPKFYIDMKDNLKEKLRAIELMYDFSIKYDRSNVYELALPMIRYDRKSIISQIQKAIRSDVKHMMKMIYSTIKNDFFISMEFIKEEEKKESRRATNPLQKRKSITNLNNEMEEVIEEKLGELDEKLRKLDKSFFDFNRSSRLYERYKYEIFPIFDQNVFTVLKVLLNKIGEKHLLGHQYDYLKKLNQAYDVIAVFSAVMKAKTRFVKYIIDDYVGDKFDEIDIKYPKNNAFYQMIRDTLVGIFQKVSTSLNENNDHHRPEVKQVMKFFFKVLLKKYLRRSPIAITMLHSIHHKIKPISKILFKSDLPKQNDFKFDRLNLMKNLLKLVEILGAKTGYDKNIVSLKVRMFELSGKESNLLI